MRGLVLLVVACAPPRPNDSADSAAETGSPSVYGLDRRPDNPDCVAFDPPDDATADRPLPADLLATGCVDPADPLAPAAGLIPYDLNAPFWSDGADKARYLGLPAGGTVTVQADGDLTFPIGTVLMKTFDLGGRRIETRLLVRHDDGAWGGYSYWWDDAQGAATLLEDLALRQVGEQRWEYPGREGCDYCHTAAAGHTLGPELGQLNRDVAYPSGVTSNQLDTLDHIGVFAPALGVAATTLSAYADPYGDASVDARARSWLHANCSYCHRPGGPTGRPMDLRHATSLADTRTCDGVPLSDQGVADARLIAPGAPERSLVYVRAVTPASRMPPIATSVVDAAGGEVLRAWIAAMPGCP